MKKKPVVDLIFYGRFSDKDTYHVFHDVLDLSVLPDEYIVTFVASDLSVTSLALDRLKFQLVAVEDRV